MAVLAFSSGCAHRQAADLRDTAAAEQAVERSCSIGRTVRQAKGRVGIRAIDVRGKSVQFSAFVNAEQQGTFRLEATNPLGGTEATIEYRDGRFVVSRPGKGTELDRQATHWNGIPLRFALELFLGRVPCPEPASLDRGSFRLTAPGTVEWELSGAERWHWEFRDENGSTWVDRLVWQSLAPGAREREGEVEFLFRDPDSKSGTPSVWEVKSRQGEVKVRWRDRESS